MCSHHFFREGLEFVVAQSFDPHKLARVRIASLAPWGPQPKFYSSLTPSELPHYFL